MCFYCGKHYTGETSQLLCQCIYHHHHNHISNTEDKSAATEHFINEHEGLPMKLVMDSVVKTKGFTDRKVSESVIAQNSENDLNRRIEGAGVVGNLYM